MDITYSVMIPLLEAFHNAFHSYGWAIIALTVLVRLLVWPLVSKSTREMQRMSQMQPIMKQIQEKYKDNPELLQRKMVEFYQKNKVNPMGGCLPTLVQLPILFALFATFTGPPFQDKPIPVKMTVVAADQQVTKTETAVSGANSPYVSKDGKVAKFAVKPGDSTIEVTKNPDGTYEPKTMDFSLTAVAGDAPEDFKPAWKIGSDTNAATIAPGTGEAHFPTAGDVTIEAQFGEAGPAISVPIKVVAGDSQGGGLFGGGGDAFKAKTEQSEQQSQLNLNGQQVTVAVTPGASTVVAGKNVQFSLKVISGNLPADFRPLWKVSKDPNAAFVDQDGRVTFPRPGTVNVEAIIPGEAEDEPFYFISSLGKVPKGMELLYPQNFDVLGMILAFAVTMYLSSKYMSTSSANMDPEQAAIQKQTQQTMPIALTAMFFFIPLPAGVYIYMVLSNVLQTLQTLLVSKQPGPGLIDVTADDGGQVIDLGNGSGTDGQNGAKLKTKKKKKANQEEHK